MKKLHNTGNPMRHAKVYLVYLYISKGNHPYFDLLSPTEVKQTKTLSFGSLGMKAFFLYTF